MNKVLGLDVGEKRIGVAISDGKVVTTYGTIENNSLQEAINTIGQICRKELVEAIVVGIPKNENTLQLDKVHTFALELAKKLQLPVYQVDETLTSKEAERMLAGSKFDPSSKAYKEEVDKMAAKLILEQYLNHNTHG